MAFLLVQSGEQKGTRFELDRDEVTLGRAADNVIQISSGAVSSHHLKIVREGQTYTVIDLDSTNGTGVNGVAVKQARLKPKDVLSVGGVEILFDGDDIEVNQAYTAVAAGPTNTVRLAPFAPASAAGPPPSFEFRPPHRHLLAKTIVAVSVVAAVVLVYFLFRLFRASAGGG